MRPDLDSPNSSTSAACYFTYQPSASSHFLIDTPSTTPSSEFSLDVFPDPLNPLLAFRPPPHGYESLPAAMDASKLLQLQTAAAHRPAVPPLQHSSSASSNNSNSSLSSGSNSPPSGFCCSRCRRSCFGANAIVKFGTNTYYCSHCASMTGYFAR